MKKSAVNFINGRHLNNHFPRFVRTLIAQVAPIRNKLGICPSEPIGGLPIAFTALCDT